MSGSAADALLDLIRVALAEDDAETVTSALLLLDDVEPASAQVIRTILYATDEAQS